MHDTARCFGYPSYSSRTAQKLAWDPARGLEPALAVQFRRRHVRHLPRPLVLPGRCSSLQADQALAGRVITSVIGPAPRASGCAARSWPVRPGRVGSSPPPQASPPRAAGGACSALPHLAGVGRSPLAKGHGSSAGSCQSTVCTGLPSALFAGALRSGAGPITTLRLLGRSAVCT
jgi:hypothetical protein